MTGTEKFDTKVGDDFLMTFRYGYDEKVHGGRTLEESVAIARVAEECGVDALHISIMTYASMQYMSASPEMPAGFNMFPTKVIKEAVKIPDIALDEAMIPRAFLMPRLAERGIQKVVNATVKEITADGCVYTDKKGEEHKLEDFDTVVLALGVKSYNPLGKELEGLVDKVLVIGDAKQPGPANKATEAGLAAAFEI